MKCIYNTYIIIIFLVVTCHNDVMWLARVLVVGVFTRALVRVFKLMHCFICGYICNSAHGYGSVIVVVRGAVCVDVDSTLRQWFK